MKKIFLLIITLAFPILATAQTASVFEKNIDFDNIIVCGQPSEADINLFREKGITLVFNVRSEEEMSDTNEIKFDEKALLKNLGIDYIIVPISGTKYPYREEVVEKFAEAVSKTGGKVILHCKSGGRAANVYGAYEIKYRDISTEEIMKQLEIFNLWPLPIEKLSGIELKLEIK